MVIFGAGASYDSVSEETMKSMPSEFRPPLAKDLFENRGPFSRSLARYPSISSVVGPLRRLGRTGGTLEENLEALKTEGTTHEPTQWALNAMRFYLRDIIRDCGDAWQNESRGSTHYTEMVRHIDIWRESTKEPVIFVTFNYDTLLEDALRVSLNVVLNRTDERDPSLATYVARDDYRLFKLHGSIDWEVAVPYGTFQFNSIEQVTTEMLIRRPSIALSDAFAYFGQFRAERIVAYPAIAVPTQNKSGSDFACPTLHQQKFVETLPKVTKLITIGWRGAERHFLDLLSGRMTSVKHAWAVAESAGSAQETTKHLNTVGVHATPLGEGFSGFIEGDGLRNCLYR
jgi:hypothetical protein